ncbi:MAG: FlgD immunoglobulin-like domain containing protein, partial [candidate division WOR-3 bacterium]
GVWYWYDRANRRFVVEYDSVRYSSGGIYDKFQLLVYDTTVQTPSGDNVFCEQFYSNNGSYGGIGMQDPTKTVAINYTGRAAAPVVSGRAIKYTTEYGTGMAENKSAGSNWRLIVEPSLFRKSTRVGWYQPEAGRALLVVSDASGRVVKNLRTGRADFGWNFAIWDGTDNAGKRVAKGFYFVSLQAAGNPVVTKLVLLE